MLARAMRSASAMLPGTWSPPVHICLDHLPGMPLPLPHGLPSFLRLPEAC